MLNSELYLADLNKIHSVIKNIEELNNKSIFITGSTGLIGSAIVDYLIYIIKHKNYKINITVGVRSISSANIRFGKYIEECGITCIKYDATKPTALNGCFDFIIHAASPATPSEYVNNPVDTMLANFVGINSILEYAVKSKNTKKVLYISSSEVYGIKSDCKPYSEREYGYLDILNNRACYPSSKRAAETLCVSYANQYGIDVSIVRPGHIYGPTATNKDVRASSQFFSDVLSGKNIVMKSKGEQIRSYCYVLDCVSSVFTVLLNGQTRVAYNISNPNSVCSIYELAGCIAKHSGKQVVCEEATDKEKSGYNLMNNSSLDSSLIEALGWVGLFDLNSGVAHTLKILKHIWN